MLDIIKKNKSHFAFVLIIAILVIGIGFSYFGMNQPTVKEVSITAEQFKFTPGVLTFNKGDEITLKIKSLDVKHGFYIDGYEIEYELPALTTVTITFVAELTGTFKIRCSVTCGNFHPYMLGELKIQPNILFYSSIFVAGLVTSIMTVRSIGVETEIDDRGFVEL